MRESLTKKERLKRKADITRVFREGKAVRCSGTHLRTADNDLGYNRVAFTCVKRFGNAVERNRAKRVAREIYRKGKSNLKPGHDLVFILYPDVRTYTDRDRHIRFLLSEAGLVHDTE
ncbi:MAG: ribonuclease P protein component [Spirochaetales bacterium]|nr:ribonuclease P protein component [Spirochaetales bacterium]